MSDRANGWLLIFGGLAIGLVLWLSPSKNSRSRSFKWAVRRDLRGLWYLAAVRHKTNVKPPLMILSGNASVCLRDRGLKFSE